MADGGQSFLKLSMSIITPDEDLVQEEDHGTMYVKKRGGV